MFVVLTEQYDDADEYGDDGPSAKASSCHRSSGTTVPIIITGTHFDPDYRAVGQGRVSRVGHDDGNLVHACFQIGNPKA